MKIKALILNGSSNKSGSVATLLKTISNNLGDTFQVDWVNVYDLNMKPCIGCRGCRKKDTECVLKEDDAHVIGRKLKEADVVIVGTPTHFSNMSSPLKNLLDRNGTTLFTEPPSGMPIPKHKGKPAVIVTACHSGWPLSAILGMSTGAIRSVKTYLKLGGFKIIGKITKSGTGKSMEINPSLIKKAELYGKRLNSITCNKKNN